MVDRATGRRAVALDRVRAVAAAQGVPGVVLTRPSSVAWASAGMNPPIDRTASTDTVWLAVGPTGYTVISTLVEEPRLRAELVPAGVDIVRVDWFDAAAFTSAAATALDARPGELASDGHADFGVDVSDDLTRVRLSLSDAEQLDLDDLARDATHAVESALRTWTPGEPDFAVASRIAAGVEQVGAEPPVLLVGGDERLARFRHPVANGARPTDLVMAVLVARRAGLHVALTRYVGRRPSAEFTASLTATQRIHVNTLEAARSHATYGDVMTKLAQGYDDAGAPSEWRYHYQGGPIGFLQREFEIAPSQRDSIWWGEPITSGTALAFNPSLPGGFKDEDTYLVEPNGDLRWLTHSNDWPTVNVDGWLRPAVLEHD
jgi:Xaa-Pro dipeptidase